MEREGEDSGPELDEPEHWLGYRQQGQQVVCPSEGRGAMGGRTQRSAAALDLDPLPTHPSDSQGRGS